MAGLSLLDNYTPKFDDTTQFGLLSDMDTRKTGIDLSVLDQYKNFDIRPFAMASVLNNNQKSSNTPTDSLDKWGDTLLLSAKDKGDDLFRTGMVLKTTAAATKLFSDIATYIPNMKNATKQAANTKLQAETEMAALDNQVLAYKNQITDKFNAVMARNAVTMAAKNLRVSSGALLEQTKDAAYDVSKDIATLESNAELKKIALRSEIAQADVTKKLQKSTLTANLIGSLANAGLLVDASAKSAGGYGNLYDTLFKKTPKPEDEKSAIINNNTLAPFEYEF